jgi:hypothetical protein
MVGVVTRQIIQKSKDICRVKLYINGDADLTKQIVFDDSCYESMIVGTNKILDLKYSLNGLSAILYWKATTSAKSFTGTGLDDMTYSGNYLGDELAPVYRVKIDGVGAGVPNTFAWSKDNGSSWEETGVNITAQPYPLESGLTILFAATTGHTLNDYWSITMTDTSKEIISLPSGTSFKYNFDKRDGGIPNDGVYKNGFILLSTSGLTSGDNGFITLTVKMIEAS